MGGLEQRACHQMTADAALWTAEQSKMMGNHAAGAPLIAIIIPVYKQPQFLIESVSSALHQRTHLSIKIVIVNDGCPMQETQDLAMAFSLGEERVHSIRTPNRGLSAARNAGIAYALAVWPNVQAFYMLDADNRLTRNAISIGFAALNIDPEVSWVYPQLNKFGMTWSGHVDFPTSPLHILFAGSFMEASSLIHRRVFDAGIRYDESMRDGYEDWEFWLQAFGRGFRGQCQPGMGLDYRYRPESMVRSASRQRAALVGALRKRHPHLYRGSAILGFEQAHHPRYAFVQGSSAVSFTDAGLLDLKINSIDLTLSIWSGLSVPEQGTLPPYLIWASPLDFEILRRAKVAQGFLRHLEAAADAGEGVAGLGISSGGDFAIKPCASIPSISLILMHTNLFAQSFLDTNENKAEILEARLAAMPLLTATIPSEFMNITGKGDDPKLQVFATLHTCLREIAGWERPRRWRWQGATLADSRELLGILRDDLGGAPLSNITRDSSHHPLCIVTDKHLAECLDAIDTYNFKQDQITKNPCLVYCDESTEELTNAVSRVWSLDLMQLPDAQASDFLFLGHTFELPPLDDANWREIRGVLAGFESILVTMPRLFPLLAEWRERGTRTLVLIPSHGFEPAGIRMVLAFEHVIDQLLVQRADQVIWFEAQGFPGEKIADLSRAQIASDPAQEAKYT
jgi:hypothetical protein